MPWVLVLPPRSNPPGFHSRRICDWKLAMIDSRNSSSPGISFSSASFRPSLERGRLINAVVSRVSGSRSTASNAGRTKGSTRRSRRTRKVSRSLSRSRNPEPVLARGCGRLTFEFIGRKVSLGSTGEIQHEQRDPTLAPVDLAQIDTRADLPDLVPDLPGNQRGLGVVQDDRWPVGEP